MELRAILNIAHDRRSVIDARINDTEYVCLARDEEPR